MFSPYAAMKVYEYARCIEDLPFCDDVILAGKLPEILNIPRIQIGIHVSHWSMITTDFMNFSSKYYKNEIGNSIILHNYPPFRHEWQHSMWQILQNHEDINETKVGED